VNTVINMAVRVVTKKQVSVFADLTMMALNVKPALKDLLWLKVNANLCSNANHSLQALEP